MPHVAIALTDLGRDMKFGAQITETASDSANDMYFVNDGMTMLVVNNKAASANAVEVTLLGVVDEHGRTLSIVETVAIGELRMFGPFHKPRWNELPGATDPPAGAVKVELDASDANCEMSAVKMSPAERNF